MTVQLLFRGTEDVFRFEICDLLVLLKVSHNPPLLSISFSLSPRRPKDTKENILATKEFTVSMISEPFIEAANITSVEAPADVDEWDISGLTKASSVSQSV
jgi:flavin reductase (DIM6/NTAB) family NADH-FMN oxidoreductase RutF